MRPTRPMRPVAILSVLVLAAPALADDAAAYLARFDQVMSPDFFEADTRMIAHREDGSVRTYKMRVQKSGTEKLRATFLEPSSAKGQEMLRNGDNLWLYMPNLKRAVRVASRDQFMGGDFNNADVLRVNYTADYAAVLGKSDDPKLVVLELKAKSPQVAYDVIKLWMTADPKTAQPVKSELYAASGKLLRTAEFTDVKAFSSGGKGEWKRPAKIVMKNALVPARFSEMVWDDGEVKSSISPQRFVLDDLGR
jgi:outer membrane lipoprotein-sorting protein